MFDSEHCQTDISTLFGCSCVACRWAALIMRVFDGDDHYDIKFFFSVIREHLSLYEEGVNTHVNSEVAKRFSRFVTAQGLCDVREITDEVALAFVNSPSQRGGKLSRPSASTQKTRRTGIRAIVRAARERGYLLNHFTGDFPIDPLGPVTRRICSSGDVDALRLGAPWGLVTSGLPSVLAFAEAGAANDEIRVLCGNDVDLTQQIVRLPGTGVLRARENELTDWGYAALSARIQELDNSDLIVFSTMRKPAISNGAVSNAFSQITLNAGLGNRGFRLDSVRAWRAQQIFADTSRIEDVARFLGLHTLDGAARFIEYHWQAES